MIAVAIKRIFVFILKKFNTKEIQSLRFCLHFVTNKLRVYLFLIVCVVKKFILSARWFFLRIEKMFFFAP